MIRRVLIVAIMAAAVLMVAPAADAHGVTAYRLGIIGGHGECRTTIPAAGTARLRCADGFARELPPCVVEDSQRCYWNAAKRSNGRGHSFIALNGPAYWTRGVWRP